eukprot:1138154-Pelagomonas_calceolata.AAC.8
MLAYNVLRVEWLPTLHSFHLASGIAVARPCPRCARKEVFPGWGRIVDCCSKDWCKQWYQVHNTDVDRHYPKMQGLPAVHKTRPGSQALLTTLHLHQLSVQDTIEKTHCVLGQCVSFLD